MTSERVRANDQRCAEETLERIHLLALAGRAALNTNLTDPTIPQAVGAILGAIEDLAAPNVAEHIIQRVT